MIILYKVNFTEFSVQDFSNLPKHLQLECKEKLEILSRVGVRFGIPLEFKYDMDLRNCYKIFFNNAKHRIVYKENNNDIEIIDIIGIGERDNFNIYKEVSKRLDR